jgi:hypothetical protein
MVTNQQYQKVLEYMAPLLLQNDSLVTLSKMKKGNIAIEEQINLPIITVTA